MFWLSEHFGCRFRNIENRSTAHFRQFCTLRSACRDQQHSSKAKAIKEARGGRIYTDEPLTAYSKAVWQCIGRAMGTRMKRYEAGGRTASAGGGQ